MIDLIYKRVLIHELVGREGWTTRWCARCASARWCMVNPFRCKVLHKKASLAVLSDERNAALFDAPMRQAIADHIPWTRVVEERTTTWQGREVDLLDHRGTASRAVRAQAERRLRRHRHRARLGSR